MNVEKLKRLQAQVRIGGKGTPRRKKKVTHQTAATDDKKLQSSLKKLSVSTIPGIEEVNIIKDDLTVIHFNNPKAQASLSANTFAVTGHGETKKVVEMLPEILPQLGQETVVQLRMFANSMTTGLNQKPIEADAASDDFANDVPLLVEDFDQIAKQEASPESVATNKNKIKASTEDKLKHEQEQEQELESDQKQEICNEKALSEHSNQAIAENVKEAHIDEMNLQATNPKELEIITEQIKEKQGKQNKKVILDKSEEIKTDVQKVANKTQNKEKKDVQGSSGSKNLQKQEVKKVLPNSKGSPKENTQKESQQSNKKVKQSNTNKTRQLSNSPIAEQLPKNENIKELSIVSNQKPTQEMDMVEKVEKNITTKEETCNKAPKDDHQRIEEQHSSSNLKDPDEQMGLIEKSTYQKQTMIKTPHSEKINTVSLEVKHPIQDLALPIPPIIPPQLTMPIQETGSKLEIIPLQYKKITDLIASEPPRDTFAINITGEDQAVNLKENIPTGITAPQATIPMELPQSKEIIETDHQKLKNEPVKSEELQPKIEPNEAIVSPEVVVRNEELAMKTKGKPATPSEQKAPGLGKQQSNKKQQATKETSKTQQASQKNVAQKETTKQPARQQQKQTPDLKKSPAGTENKKDGETPKAKPAAIKPRLANNNNTGKQQSPQKLQEQSTKKTPAIAPALCKSNENPSTTLKPPNITKTAAISTATTSKKPGATVNPNASNLKTSSPATENKNKANTTAIKAKVQPTPASQKQGKPRTNRDSATTTPNRKTTEKQTTPPIADLKAQISTQITAKQ